MTIISKSGDVIRVIEEGPAGKSAYEVWLAAGNAGTEEDFLASLSLPDLSSRPLILPYEENDLVVIQREGAAFGQKVSEFTPPDLQAQIDNKIPLSQRGAANGVATLDNGGKVPAGQLPSYVDDILEYANLAAFPSVGETGKMYVAVDTTFLYRWSGSVYVHVVNVTAADLGLGNVNNTSDVNKPISTAQAAALAIKADLDGVGGRMLPEQFPTAFSPIVLPYQGTDKIVMQRVGDTVETNLSDLTSYIRTKLPLNRKSTKRQAFSNQNNPMGEGITTTNNVVNTSRRHVVANNPNVTTNPTWSGIRLHYNNWYNSFSMVANKYIVATSNATITIQASVQVGATIYPCTGTLVLTGGQSGYLDIPTVTLSPGTVFYTHTYMTKAAGSSRYPANSRITANPAIEQGSIQGTDTAVNIATTGLPFGATGTATVTTGNITALTRTAGGSGYTQDAAVYAYMILPNGVYAQKQVGTATVSGGAVTALTLTDGTPPAGVTAWVSPKINIIYGGSIISAAASANANGFGPSIVTGIPSVAVRSVLLLGDSITRGIDGNPIGDQFGNCGNFEVSIANKCGVINLGIRGYRAFDFTGNAAAMTDYIYNYYAPFCTDVIVNLGINDPAWPLADDINDCVASLNDIGVKLRAFDLGVTFSTITPRASSSTDSYTTLDGQVAQTWISGTILYNDFSQTLNLLINNGYVISDNAPIQFADLIADPVERNKFRVSDGLKTSDGLHPTDVISGTRSQNGVSISVSASWFRAQFDYLYYPNIYV